MRLLLHVHLSRRWIGQPLQRLGHDVKAADADPQLSRRSDDELFTIAAAENRILVSRNARHFARIARNWTMSRREYAGCALLVRIDHSEFGLIISRLEKAFAERPKDSDWINYTGYVSRGRSTSRG